MFLRNYWYAAALHDEVGRAFLSRTICGEPVILFRSEAGDPVALENRCCHRSLPLSEGKLIGDTVQCGYHGLEFDCAGTCINVPGQTAVPPSAGVKSYPVVEKHRFIWIWIGDAEAADPDRIPDYHWLDDPDWRMIGGHMPLKAHYMLSIDNLMDLTHEYYVHRSTLGAESITDHPIATERRDEGVTVTRWLLDEDPGPFWRDALATGENADRWQIVNYYPPGHTMLDVGVAPSGAGAPDGDRTKAVEARVCITLTPETEKTAHYFWGFARSWRTDDAETDKVFTGAIVTAYTEDIVVLEAQQKSMDGTDDPWKIDVNADAAQLATRRLHDRLLAEQQDGTTAQAAE